MSALDRSLWTIRELGPADADFLSALHLAHSTSPGPGQTLAASVQDLLEGVTAGMLLLRPVVAAFERGRIRTAVTGVESAGASNLLVIPYELDSEAELEGGLQALHVARELSWNYCVRLSQVIGPDRASKWDVVLRESGFTRLTHLIYMSRSMEIGNIRAAQDHPGPYGRWIPYSSASDPVFCEAIAQSYVQSMDCPELTGLRSPQASLMSHRAAGVFDPAMWFVLVEADQPLGVLLLSKVRRESLIEIVYMGVSQLVRGRGVADLLMAKALRTASASGSGLILAVDERNAPAMRLYTRWNFVQIARRAAWIASPHGIGR